MTENSIYTFLTLLAIVVTLGYLSTELDFVVVLGVAGGLIGLYTCYMIFEIANHLKNILKLLHEEKDDKNKREATSLSKQLQQD